MKDAFGGHGFLIAEHIDFGAYGNRQLHAVGRCFNMSRDEDDEWSIYNDPLGMAQEEFNQNLDKKGGKKDFDRIMRIASTFEDRGIMSQEDALYLSAVARIPFEAFMVPTETKSEKKETSYRDLLRKKDYSDVRDQAVQYALEWTWDHAIYSTKSGRTAPLSYWLREEMRMYEFEINLYERERDGKWSYLTDDEDIPKGYTKCENPKVPAFDPEQAREILRKNLILSFPGYEVEISNGYKELPFKEADWGYMMTGLPIDRNSFDGFVGCFLEVYIIMKGARDRGLEPEVLSDGFHNYFHRGNFIDKGVDISAEAKVKLEGLCEYPALFMFYPYDYTMFTDWYFGPSWVLVDE